MAGFDTRNVARISGSSRTRDEDLVTSEEALSISLSDEDHGLHNIGVTMRTRGDDRFLVLGFLFSEGIIDSIDQVVGIDTDEQSVTVSLGNGSSFDPDVHCRPSTITSACGICGRSTTVSYTHLRAHET